MTKLEHLPVAVIGGGPVGLAAAAHLVARGLPVNLYEAGERSAQISGIGAMCGSSRRGDTVSTRRRGRSWPLTACRCRTDDSPTGGELLIRYLAPLAATLELAAVSRPEPA